jgi:putative mRNA 3-end processing factor
MRRFGEHRDAFASGWMQLRGARRRRAVDLGLVMSDHADWPGLQRAIRATGAERVYVTHGYVPVMVRWLAAQGLDARAFDTEYGDEQDDDARGTGDTAVAAGGAEPGAREGADSAEVRGASRAADSAPDEMVTERSTSSDAS